MATNNYNLTITDANHHLAEVEIEFNGILTRTLEVKLPVWRTGKYQVLNLAENIRKFKAYDKKGKELTWNKMDKNSWRIFINTPGKVRVKYQLYANLLSQRVSHIDATHAYLDASGVFMYSESHRDKELTVKLNVPEEWRSVSGLQRLGMHEFSAINYDVLVDSPIETGLHIYDSVKVDEQLYEIVIWGEGNHNIEKLKEDIIKLHHQAKNIWKTFPFKRYLYIYHAGNKLRGATEHLNSTVIQQDRFGFYPDDKYRKVMGITAHEFVHTWNVKAYRPAGISPYDYDKENYSDLFWIAEGTTSYYDNLLNLRAGIYSKDDFFEILSKDINSYLNKPGREVMSLSESSFDSWIHGTDTNYKHNNSVSIYLKGSLVSWLLDKEIRQSTNNKKSLDDLHESLYKNFHNVKNGYNRNDVLNLLQELTNKSFSDFWKNYVDGTEEIDFNDLLGFYGLKFKQAKNKEETKASFGAKFKNSQGRAVVSLVERNSPAWKAGLTANDTLVALDGFELNYENVESRISQLKANQSYDLHYFHDGKLIKTIIKPKAAAQKLEIVEIDSAIQEQQDIFRSWTGQDLLEKEDDNK